MEYTIKDKGTFSGDLAAMLNLQDYYDDDPFLKVADYREDVTYAMDYQNQRETITRYISDAQDQERNVLMLRDSFGGISCKGISPGDPDGLPYGRLRCLCQGT